MVEKMKNDPDTETSNGAPTAEIPHDDVQRLLYFFRQHGIRIVIYIAAAFVVLAAFGWFKSRKGEGIARAASMLSAAHSVQNLQEVISLYPESPSASIATLMLAKTYYDSGNHALADGAYADFIQKYPTHSMVPVAELGRAHVQEAIGQTEQAVQAYAAFAKKYPTHFLLADAMLSQARGMTTMGRTGEARILYEDFIAAHPNSSFVAEAETALNRLKRTVSAPAPTPASPPPVVPSAAPATPPNKS